MRYFFPTFLLVLLSCSPKPDVTEKYVVYDKYTVTIRTDAKEIKLMMIVEALPLSNGINRKTFISDCEEQYQQIKNNDIIEVNSNKLIIRIISQ